MEARVGIGEAWPLLSPGNLSGHVQACLSRLKPTQARNGPEVRVWVRVLVRPLINCSSNPIATGEAKWIPPSPEFPSCAQLDCRGYERKGYQSRFPGKPWWLSAGMWSGPSPSRTCFWNASNVWALMRLIVMSSETLSGTCWLPGARGCSVSVCSVAATERMSCSAPARSEFSEMRPTSTNISTNLECCLESDEG